MTPISLQDLTIKTCDLFRYFGRDKMPGNDRIALWYPEIKSINPDDITEAFSIIRKNYDACPVNIPKAIKQAVFEINKSKPEVKYKIGHFGNCENGCNGTGMFKILAKDPNQKKWIESIVFCGACENWKIWTNNPGMKMRSAELSAAGYIFKPYNKVLKHSVPKPVKKTMNNVADMASQLAALKAMHPDIKRQPRNIDPETQEVVA